MCAVSTPCAIQTYRISKLHALSAVSITSILQYCKINIENENKKSQFQVNVCVYCQFLFQAPTKHSSDFFLQCKFMSAEHFLLMHVLIIFFFGIEFQFPAT